MQKYCPRCKERWFDIELKSNVYKRCRDKDADRLPNEPFFYSAKNEMDFGSIPSDLPKLTIVKQFIISPMYIFT